MQPDNTAPNTDRESMAEPALITIQEAATLLGIHVRQVRKYIQKGTLQRAAHRGQQHLFHREAVCVLAQTVGRGEQRRAPSEHLRAEEWVPIIQQLQVSVVKLTAEVTILRELLDMGSIGLRWSADDFRELVRRLDVTRTNLKVWSTEVVSDWCNIVLLLDEEDLFAMWELTQRCVWVDFRLLIGKIDAISTRAMKRLAADRDFQIVTAKIGECHRRLRTSIYLLRMRYGHLLPRESMGGTGPLEAAILGKIRPDLRPVADRLPRSG
jgi:excisionase family DNA binding protein